MSTASRSGGTPTRTFHPRAGPVPAARPHLGVVHPQESVYLLGPVMLPHARELATAPPEWFGAAVLACGPGAVLGHGNAAALREMMARLPEGAPGGRHGPGSQLRSQAGHPAPSRAALEPHEVANRDGIPVTAPLRTLLDLAAAATTPDLAELELGACRLTS